MRRFTSFVFLLIIICAGGCSNKKLNSIKFTDILNDNGCIISDNLDNKIFSKEMSDYLIASCNNVDIQYITSDQDYINDIFNVNYEAVAKEKTGTNIENKKFTNKYCKYELTCNGYYKYLYKRNNTFIYVTTSDEYKDDAIMYINLLGCK